MRAVNAAVMRRFNRQLILNRIRKGPVSRMELAEATGLTRASVAQIVEQLIGEGIVVETLRSGRERSGRRSTQLTVVGSAGMIFGVSLNAERCEVGAINLRGIRSAGARSWFPAGRLGRYWRRSRGRFSGNPRRWGRERRCGHRSAYACRTHG